MKDEYFCDYLALRILGEDEWIELDNIKVIYTDKVFDPPTISARLLLNEITEYQKQWLRKCEREGVEVIWVPYDKEYTMEMVGNLHYIKSGRTSFSFRITENNTPNTNKEDDLYLLRKFFKKE